MKRRVLFLCTENSCRSQMAEAIVNHDLARAWEAYSAGTRPTGSVHPLAVATLAEIGILHQGRSKSVEEFREVEFDLVVTLCDAAAEECPGWLGLGRRLHISFPDPAQASGSDAEKMDAFRRARDDMRPQIVTALQSLTSR